jgi:apolipoprotein N-acyltransferase
MSISRSLSRVATLVCLFFAARIFAFDWLSCDGRISNLVAIGFLFCVASCVQPFTAFLLGFAFSLVALSSSFFWAERMLAYSLNQDGNLPKIVFWLLIAFESMPIAMFSYFASRSRWAANHAQSYAVGLAWPIAFWLFIESCWPRVFPWTLGHSLIGWNSLIQIVDLGGANLLSCLALYLSAVPLCLADLIRACFGGDRSLRNRRLIDLSVISLALGCASVYGMLQTGMWSTKLQKDKALRIGVVQEDPSFVDSINKMRAASESLSDGVDLFVWPESTLGALSTGLRSTANETEVRASALPPYTDLHPTVGLKAPLVVGGRTFEGIPREDATQFQSALVIDTDGSILARYHKQKLMPLGEFVPGEYRWPWLHDWFQLNEYIVPGTDSRPIQIANKASVGLLVCFEDIVPAVARNAVAQGAELLICIINASAFEDPIAIEQHLLLARLRAVENRRYFVRSAGTGVSCTINPVGNIEYRSPIDQPDAFVANVRCLRERTFYSYAGNWAPYAAITLLLIGRLIGKKNAKETLLA